MTAQGSQLPAAPRRPGPPKELLSSPAFLLKKLGLTIKERTIEAFEETGLSGYHHSVLALLHEEPRETQAMIADALGYHRSHLVGLTPAGEEALERVRAVAKRVEDEFFKPLDASERKTLKALLARLASHH